MTPDPEKVGPAGAPPDAATGKPPEAAPAPDERREAGRRDAEGAARREREKARGVAERAAFREKAPKLPELPKEKLPTDIEKFREKASIEAKEGVFMSAIDWPVVNSRREEFHINGDKWDVSKEVGLQQILFDITKLEIYQKAPGFYDNLFAVLNSGIDPTKNPYKAPGDPNSRLFEDPFAHGREIAALGPMGSFDPEAYRIAIEHVLKIKGRLYAQDRYQIDSHNKQSGAGSEPISKKIGDFAKDNVNEIRKAVREKDYGKLAMYAAGAYFLYKAWGQLTEGEKGATFKKWAIYGGAAYAGHLLLKNAGYDVLEMAGLKDKNAIVKGTPMESMAKILKANESLREDEKDIDYSIVLQMQDVNLVRLNDLYHKTNKEGTVPMFIHPTEFSDIFDSEVLAEWPFEMTLKEAPSTDQNGFAGLKNRKQEQYVHLGYQLYKIASAMRHVYTDTLRKDHPLYQGQSYEEAFGSEYLGIAPPSGSRGIVKVRHLLEDTSQYAERTPTRIELRSKDKVEEELRAYFDTVTTTATKPDFHLTDSTSNHFPGELNGYPIVVVQTGKDSYRLYMKDKYGGKDKPGRDFIEFTPGSGNRSAELATQGVKKRMLDLISNVASPSGRNTLANTLKYIDGEWKADIEFPAVAEYGIAKTPASVTLKPTADGKGLMILDQSGEVMINLDEELTKLNPVGSVILMKLVGQSDFAALKPLQQAKRIKITDNPANDGTFKLEIGGRKINVNLKFDSATGKFEFVNPADESEMLKPGSGFSEELRSALREDPRIAEIKESWRKMIQDTPESYFVHFFKSVPSWFKNFQWTAPWAGMELNDITGSVAKQYTLSLIDAQVEHVLAKVMHGANSASTLDDVSDAISQDFNPAIRKLDQQRMRFSAMNTRHADENTDWSEEQYNTEVLEGLTTIGISDTGDYQYWHREFVGMVFSRLGNDDFSEKRNRMAGDLVNVFSYYASAVDDPDNGGANLSLTITEAMKDDIAKVDTARATLVAGGNPTPTSAQIAAELNTAAGTPGAYDDSYVDTLVRTKKDFEKMKKYKKRAAYVNHVVSQIDLKINEGALNKNIIPSPESSYWGIEGYSSWSDAYDRGLRDAIPSIDDLVDGNEILKMKGSYYVPFDKYLKMSPAEKAATSEDQICLPRKDVQDMQMTAGTPEYELFKKLMGYPDYDNENIHRTEIEKEFAARMNRALDKIEERYKDDIKRGKFDHLRERLTYIQPGYSFDPPRSATDPAPAPGDLVTLDFIANPTDGVGSIKGGSILGAEINSIESRLKTGDTRTITRGRQDQILDDEVARIIKQQILGVEYNQYFRNDTLKDVVKDKWEDFKIWLFG